LTVIGRGHRFYPARGGNIVAQPTTARALAAPDVLVKELRGEAVLLDLNTERYFGLDPIGTRAWSLLTTQPTIDEAYRAMLAEYDVDPEQLRRDLDGFVARLRGHGLLEVDDGAAPDDA